VELLAMSLRVAWVAPQACLLAVLLHHPRPGVCLGGVLHAFLSVCMGWPRGCPSRLRLLLFGTLGSIWRLSLLRLLRRLRLLLLPMLCRHLRVHTGVERILLRCSNIVCPGAVWVHPLGSRGRLLVVLRVRKSCRLRLLRRLCVKLLLLRRLLLLLRRLFLLFISFAVAVAITAGSLLSLSLFVASLDLRRRRLTALFSLLDFGTGSITSTLLFGLLRWLLASAGFGTIFTGSLTLLVSSAILPRAFYLVLVVEVIGARGRAVYRIGSTLRMGKVLLLV
jgi:hypothetical protein